MRNKKLALPMLSLIALALVGSLVSAVVIYAAWSNNGPSMTINKGDSATFTVDVGSFTPPTSYSIKLYDKNFNLVSTLKDTFTDSEHIQETMTLTPASYNNLGGIYTIIIQASDKIGSAYNNQLTLKVVQSAPQVGNIPDVQMEQDKTLTAFDLDDYVSDADDALSSLMWTVSGNSNISVQIDANTHSVTLAPNAGFVGQNTLTFTATDPSGDSDSDTVVVEVFAKGKLPVTKKVTLHRVDVEYFGDSLLKIRNGGSLLEDLRLKVTVESADAAAQTFNFDLHNNRVAYKLLDIENLEPGVYLARVELRDDDDFDENGYILVEKF